MAVKWSAVSTAVAVLLLGGLPAAGASTPASASPAPIGMSQAYAAQSEATSAWLGTGDVLGTGIGRTAAGAPTVVVFVADASVPVPATVAGVPTRKLVTGVFEPQGCPSGPAARCDRPVPLGVSTGHPSVTAGTLGALVEDAAGQQYALSNNHIFANENNAAIGDEILQPGRIDGGSTVPNSPDKIGTLADFRVVQQCPSTCTTASPSNFIDAALASVTPGTVSRQTLCGWTPAVTTVPVSALVPNTTQVKKCGRTTGATSGTVVALNATVAVDFGPNGSPGARFDNQIVTTGIGWPGDSGSLVVDNNNHPVGLLMAGSGSFTISNPIDAVLSAFGVSIDDGIDGGPPSTPASPSCTTPANSWGTRAVTGGSTPNGQGYWLAAADGFVAAAGNAHFEGDASCLRLNGPILGGTSLPHGVGYWLNGQDGGVFTYGAAGFFGSMGAARLNQPVFSMASTATGNGYWLVAYDGGIFSFGDAPFYGSTGAVPLVQPIIAVTTSASGGGYRLVGRDGGIFSFGDAPFYGSLPSAGVSVDDVVGMAPTPSGQGYWIIRAGGETYAFGDAGYFGNANVSPSDPVVAVIANPVAQGYRLVFASFATAGFGVSPG